MLILVCMLIVMLVGMLMVILEVDQHQIQVPASYQFVMIYPSTNICYIKLFSSLIYLWMNHKVHHCNYNNMFMYLNNLTNFKLQISSGWVVYNMCKVCIHHVSRYHSYFRSSKICMFTSSNHCGNHHDYRLISYNFSSTKYSCVKSMCYFSSAKYSCMKSSC